MNYETRCHRSRDAIADFYRTCADHALVVDARRGFPFEPALTTSEVPAALVEAGVRVHHATVARRHGVAELIQAGQRVAIDHLDGHPAVAITYEPDGAHLRLFGPGGALADGECWAIRQALADQLGEAVQSGGVPA